jgi:hypothetical protein
VNPLWLWIIGHTTARRLLRQCPRCHHRQLGPKDRQHEVIRCERCGADIPPKEP